MNSTGSNSHQLLDYNRFIGPNSPVDIHIQRAIQVVENHDSLPYCQKMAASSLIHSCATLQGKTDEEETGGTSRDMNTTLGEEKTLYAARLAVCELSDSKVPVPKQCTSFIPTRETTKKTGWFGYLPVPGVWKSIVRYPDYEQATKRDRDACVQALYASNQAWHSYSNAGQDAVKLCHAVRGDIERDEELQMHRGLTENVANVAEAMRHMNETIRIQEEAMDYLVIRTQQLTEDLLKDLPELRAMYRQTVIDLTDDVLLVARKVSEVSSALDAHNSDIRASGEHLERLAAAAGSHLSELLEQHTANVDVAFQDAANSHQRVKFANELFMQQLIRHQDDMLSNAYQVEALATGAVRTLDIVNGQGADLRDTVEAVSTMSCALHRTRLRRSGQTYSSSPATSLPSSVQSPAHSLTCLQLSGTSAPLDFSPELWSSSCCAPAVYGRCRSLRASSHVASAPSPDYPELSSNSSSAPAARMFPPYSPSPA
jgi:hypothetical protein